MKVSRRKLEIAMAKACMPRAKLEKKTGLSCTSISNAALGREVLPTTVGKIARALGVDVEDLMAE